MESCKVYVDVNATFTKDGWLLPRSFIWTDGHVYEIQRVTGCAKGGKPESRRRRDALHMYCGWKREPSFL